MGAFRGNPYEADMNDRNIGGTGRSARSLARVLALACALSLAACEGTSGDVDATDPGMPQDPGIVDPGTPDAGPDLPGDVVATDTTPDAMPDDGPDEDPGTADPGDPDPGAGDPGTPDSGHDWGPPPCEGDLAPQPLPADPDTTFHRGPYVQDVRTDKAVIVWRTAVPETTEGCVRYNVADADQVACDTPDERGQYEVLLSGLPPDTAIPYAVEVGETKTTVPLAFRTAPDTPRPVRLLVFADGHYNESVLDPIARAGLADGVDLAVSVGDLVSQPEETQFDQALNGLRTLMHRVPMYAVLGNHEARGANHFAAFVVPGAAPDAPQERYYSVRHGNVWMGMLEVIDFEVSMLFGMDTDQVAWLKRELDGEAARTARWRLLFIHHPPWSLGWGHCDGYHGEESLRQILLPLAAEKGVAAIFSGHMHGYERGEVDGVTLVVNGGAGGGLDIECPEPEDFPSPWVRDYAFHRVTVDAACDALTVEAHDLDDVLIDRFELPWVEPGT